MEYVRRSVPMNKWSMWMLTIFDVDCITWKISLSCISNIVSPLKSVFWECIPLTGPMHLKTVHKICTEVTVPMHRLYYCIWQQSLILTDIIKQIKVLSSISNMYNLFPSACQNGKETYHTLIFFKSLPSFVMCRNMFCSTDGGVFNQMGACVYSVSIFKAVMQDETDNQYFWLKYDRTEVPLNPSSTRPGFELMTSRS